MIVGIAAAEGLRDWLFDRAEKLEDEGYPNGANGSRVWGEAVDAVLSERADLLAALKALMADARPSNWDDGDDPEQVAAWKLADAAVARIEGPQP